MLLLLQVLYTLTNWRWVKTLLGVFFVLHIALSVFGVGVMISLLPKLMNMLQQLFMTL
jgi:hypothetical protein